MSAYLQIAETILRAFRRPLSARTIMNEAIRMQLLPPHLFGRTQHKTLQARLSEDILLRRELSKFCRTDPGQFFLSELLTDEAIPPEYRKTITARRRTRDLIRGEPLVVNEKAVQCSLQPDAMLSASEFFSNAPSEFFSYTPYPEKDEPYIPVWSLGFVRRGDQILGHRAGRYRDGRDDFALKRTLTFATLTLESDQTLFDVGHLGIENSALSAVAIDLDIPSAYGSAGLVDFSSQARFVRKFDEKDEPSRLLVYVEISPPSWFEPVTRRLSLNDLRWVSISPPPNNVADFDPWSQTLIEALTADDAQRLAS